MLKRLKMRLYTSRAIDHIQNSPEWLAVHGPARNVASTLRTRGLLTKFVDSAHSAFREGQRYEDFATNAYYYFDLHLN